MRCGIFSDFMFCAKAAMFLILAFLVVFRNVLCYFIFGIVCILLSYLFFHWVRIGRYLAHDFLHKCSYVCCASFILLVLRKIGLCDHGLGIWIFNLR